MKCLNCNSDNKYGSKYCTTCGRKLMTMPNYNNSNGNSAQSSALKIFLVFFAITTLLPIISIGIFFCYIGFSVHKEADSVKENVEQTTGILINYFDCEYDSNGELCRGKYKYTVDGMDYYVDGDIKTSKESLKKEEIVYYDSKNPSNATTSYDAAGTEEISNIFYSIGMIALIAVLIIIFIIVMIIKGIKKKNAKVETTSNTPIRL